MLSYYFWKALQRCGVNVCDVFCGGVHFDLSTVGEPPAAYDFFCGSVTELTPYVDRTDALSKLFLAEAAAKKHRCVWATKEDELAAFRIFGSHRAPVSNQLDLLVPEGLLYTYKGYTLPGHRRQGMAKWLSIVDERRLNPERKLWLWYIEKGNRASHLQMQSDDNVNANRIGMVGWFNLFGRELPFSSRSARRRGVQLTRQKGMSSQ